MPRSPSPRALTLDAEVADRARVCRQNDYLLAMALAPLAEGKLFREFGYANLGDYAQERHQIASRRARDLARVGNKLAELPVMNRAMADGEIDVTKVRDVLAKVTPESDAAWTELARTHNNRQLEWAARNSVDGFPPTHVGPDPRPEEDVVTIVLRCKLADAEWIHTATQHLRALCGPGTEPIEDGALLAMICQRALAEADPETAPSPERHRFVIEHAGDEPVALGDEACCDAEVVEMGSGPKRGHLSHTIPPARRRSVLHRDGHRCTVPGCSNRLWIDIHHVRFREHGGSHHENNLASVCCVHHRLIHDGYLDITGEAGAFRFTFPDGRQIVRTGRRAPLRIVRDSAPASPAG